MFDLVEVLKEGLWGVNAAKVRMPTDNEVAMYMEMIQDQYPALSNCWGAMDGLKVGLEATGDVTCKTYICHNSWFKFPSVFS